MSAAKELEFNEIEQLSIEEIQTILQENVKLKKINASLMKRVEQNMDDQGTAFSLFQTNCSLEEKINERTSRLEYMERELKISNRQLMILNEELIKEKESAEAANISKSQFLANMSHELRTPMHGILSFAKFGLKKFKSAEPEKIQSYFTEIYDSASSLMILLNDLLDLSKLESSNMEYHFSMQSLVNVISSCVGEFTPMAVEKGIKIKTFWKGRESQISGMIDTNRIMQVLRNLISNAIKFSDIGSEINIYAKNLEIEGVDYISFKISNQGVEIPCDEADEIFDKFKQSSKTKSSAGGTGLGLAISKRIIEDHSGRIWVEPNNKGRTIFEFIIPKGNTI